MLWLTVVVLGLLENICHLAPPPCGVLSTPFSMYSLSARGVEAVTDYPHTTILSKFKRQPANCPVKRT